MNDSTIRKVLYGLLITLLASFMNATKGSIAKVFTDFENMSVIDNREAWIFSICFLITAFLLLNTYFENRQRKKKIKENLLPYFTKIDIKEYTKNYISSNIQTLPPSYEEEPINTPTTQTKNKAIPFFLKTVFKKDDHRYYVILAGSGMGKTTFLINLYLHYINQFKPEFDIKLIPFNNLDSLKELEELRIADRRKTILLLDAFDEDPKAVVNYSERLQRVMELVWNFKIVLITCRTQFFPKEKEEPYEILIPNPKGGNFKFRKFYLSPFDMTDCKRYLNKKFGYFPNHKKNKAIGILQRATQIMVRPMILSRIDDLLLDKKEYRYKFEIYEQMINSWIHRERNKQVLLEQNKEIFEKNLRTFSRETAYRIYNIWKETGQFLLSWKEISIIANKNNIDLDKWKLTGKSLLNRDAVGNWKFAHKSILEYYLTKLIFDKNGVESFRGISFAKELYEEYAPVTFLNQFLNQGLFFYNKKEKILAISDSVKNIRYRKKNKKVKFKQINFKKLPEFHQVLEIEISLPIPVNLKGVNGFRNLNTLDLREAIIDSIKSIISIPNLKKLSLRKTGIKYIEPLLHLKNIKILSLNGVEINSIEPLSKLITLKWLSLQHTQIDSVESLSKLNALNWLSLKKTNIDSIEPLLHLKNLNSLDLSQTNIRTLLPLSDLISLKNLYLEQTQINTISPLAKLFKLEILDLRQTQIDSLESLRKLINLKELYLNQTQIISVEPLAKLTKLTVLNLTQSPIISIEPLVKLTNLSILSLSQTRIKSIAPLAKLTNLTLVSLHSIKINSFEPLMNLTSLKGLFLTAGYYDEKELSKLKKKFPRLKIDVKK